MNPKGLQLELFMTEERLGCIERVRQCVAFVLCNVSSILPKTVVEYDDVLDFFMDAEMEYGKETEKNLFGLTPVRVGCLDWSNNELFPRDDDFVETRIVWSRFRSSPGSFFHGFGKSRRNRVLSKHEFLSGFSEREKEFLEIYFNTWVERIFRKENGGKVR